MLTNGTLMVKEMISDLLEYVDVINVSIDGAKAETHERFRGNGTFGLTIENIRRLREGGFQKINLSPTLSRLNLNEAPALMDLARELDVGVDFSVFVPAGRGSCNADELYIHPRKMMETFLQCWQRSLEYGIPAEIDKIETPFFPAIRHICGAAGSMISVAADGSVYPCHAIHHPAFRLGAIDEPVSLEEMLEREPAVQFRESVVDAKEDCRECNVRYFCGGGCRTHSFNAKGSIHARDPYCLFYRWYFEAAIWTMEMEHNSGENLKRLLRTLQNRLGEEAVGDA